MSNRWFDRIFMVSIFGLCISAAALTGECLLEQIRTGDTGMQIVIALLFIICLFLIKTTFDMIREFWG